MPERALRSGIVVPLPEAAALVDEWRERTCAAKPSRGVPAHVTLVFPFAPAALLDEELVGRLGGALAGFPAVDVLLGQTGRFPGTLYLVPEPRAPFLAMTAAVAERFPGWPPYAGEFDELVPHLTVAEGKSTLLDEVEADVKQALPLAARAREVLLLEEVEPNWARWAPRAAFPLGEGR